jgi:hypothetical protein
LLAVDKYLRIKEDRSMPQIIEPTSTDSDPEAQRAIIRPMLDAIAFDIGMELRDAHLDFPVYLTVPSSGQSLATIATPLDPSTEDWAYAMAIACRIIEKQLDDVRLRSRPLACAMANARIGAADVCADTEDDS